MSSTESERRPAATRRSLRRAIAIRLAVGTAIVLFVASWLIFHRIESRLVRELDRVLLSRARAIATMTELEAGRHYVLEFDDVLMPEFSRKERPDYYQIWVERGTLLGRSRSLGEHDLEHDARLEIAPTFGNRALPDGRPGRAVELDFAPQNEVSEAVFEDRRSPDGPEVPLAARTATVVVATGLAELERTLAVVRNLTIAAGAVLFLLLLGLGNWAIAAGLAPLGAIGRQVDAIRPGMGAARIELPEGPREIEPLLRQLNEMLERNRAAFEREKQLSSDLAHELRTPVTELRNLAEVGQRWPEDAAATRAFFLDVAGIAAGMEQTLETLLALARVEAGIERPERRPTALAPLLEAALARVAAEAERRGVRWGVEAPPDVVVAGDDRLLGLLVRILVDNGVAHTPPGSNIVARITRNAGDARLSVTNPAPELRSADLERIFDRFWRADPARSDNRHSGLGLSLASALAEAMDLRLEAHLDLDGLFRITIVFPADRLSETTRAADP